MPFTSFSEYDTIGGKKLPVWFAVDDSRPLLAFAGIWANWKCVRRAKEGEITADVYEFLTCQLIPVGKVHPKAMPVILTTAEEYDLRICHGTKPRPCKGPCRTHYRSAK